MQAPHTPGCSVSSGEAAKEDSCLVRNVSCLHCSTPDTLSLVASPRLTGSAHWEHVLPKRAGLIHRLEHSSTGHCAPAWPAAAPVPDLSRSQGVSQPELGSSPVLYTAGWQTAPSSELWASPSAQAARRSAGQERLKRECSTSVCTAGLPCSRALLQSTSIHFAVLGSGELHTERGSNTLTMHQ